MSLRGLSADPRRVAAIAVALVLLLPSWPEAHEIPADVTVRAFVKPEAGTLRFLVRVPLGAMRDYDFPEREGVFLDIRAADALIRQAAQQWIGDYVSFFENGVPLEPPRLVSARISAPGDLAFASWESALARSNAPPLDAGSQLPWRQAMLDALFEVSVASANSEFSIDTRLAHLGLRTVTVLRFLPPDGAERIFQYTGVPGVVRLDPRWHQAALRFVVLGFQHILDGIDHLLFLFCLVIPFRSFRTLVPIVTSFTVAHSITLVASAMGLAPDVLWFPALIESLIALSIVVMAFENILGAKIGRRWVMAFGFGLVHGFGFSFALSESLQFAGRHLLLSLLSFNLGVELGQLFVLAIMVPVLVLMFRRVVPEAIGTVVLSAVLAHTGWHWMSERGERLLQYDFRPPLLNAGLGAAVLRWIALGVIVLGAAWLLRMVFARLARKSAGAQSEARS